MVDSPNRRILVVDDQESIREDFRKILASAGAPAPALASARAAFFGGESAPVAAPSTSYELTLASQGEEACELAERAQREGRAFALAFVDVRMPPGIDGLQTIKRLWKHDPELEVVICTAFSDYSFEQIVQELGHSSRLLILKKPFDPIEDRKSVV